MGGSSSTATVDKEWDDEAGGGGGDGEGEYYWYYGYLQSVNKRGTILCMTHLGLDINSSHNLGRQYKIVKTDQNIDQLAVFKFEKCRLVLLKTGYRARE